MDERSWVDLARSQGGALLGLRGSVCDWGVSLDSGDPENPWVFEVEWHDERPAAVLTRRPTFEKAARVLAAQASRVGPGSPISDLEAGTIDGIVVLAAEDGGVDVVARADVETYVSVRTIGDDLEVEGEWTDLGDAVRHLVGLTDNGEYG